jgi:hypothetical protein
MVAFVALATPAAAQQREAWEPPTLTITRYDEDWSKLSDPQARDGHWTEPFKYVALAPDTYLTTGIEIRARNEDYRDPLWGSAPVDGYLWIRAMPYADLHSGTVRVFVQPIAAYAVGVAPAASPIDQTRVDLLQAFADARLGAVTLRAGRQMLSLGSERLVGTRYGPNVPLAFDGFRATATVGGATVNLIAVRPVVPGPESFDDRRSRAKSLWGAYVTMPNLDLYYLGYRNRAARYATQSGDELRHSVGVRWHGDATDWHWNVEGVAQFGRFAHARIGAWTVAVEGGKRWQEAPLAPDATLRVNVISGDGKAGDRTLGTFNALFPKGKYFGELSPVGPTNIISANPRVAVSLGGDVSASLAGMAYWRYARADGVYDIPGNLIRAAGSSDERFIGKEVEATLAWEATPELELSTSLSAFAPGAFIRETGPARTIGMLGVESNFRF